MSSTGRVDKGVVTQDDNTIDDGNDSLDASYMTDTDPADLRAQTIEVMRRAGAILEANGRGTREERAANRRCRFEEELNGDLTDEEVEGGPRREGMNAEESLPPAVAEASRGEGVEVEGGGGGGGSAYRGWGDAVRSRTQSILDCGTGETRCCQERRLAKVRCSSGEDIRARQGLRRPFIFKRLRRQPLLCYDIIFITL